MITIEPIHEMRMTSVVEDGEATIIESGRSSSTCSSGTPSARPSGRGTGGASSLATSSSSCTSPKARRRAHPPRLHAATAGHERSDAAAARPRRPPLAVGASCTSPITCSRCSRSSPATRSPPPVPEREALAEGRDGAAGVAAHRRTHPAVRSAADVREPAGLTPAVAAPRPAGESSPHARERQACGRDQRGDRAQVVPPRPLDEVDSFHRSAASAVPADSASSAWFRGTSKSIVTPNVPSASSAQPATTSALPGSSLRSRAATASDAACRRAEERDQEPRVDHDKVDRLRGRARGRPRQRRARMTTTEREEEARQDAAGDGERGDRGGVRRRRRVHHRASAVGPHRQGG
jgi:hypothetical protein